MTWREQPQLFSNGKFEVKITEGVCSILDLKLGTFAHGQEYAFHLSLNDNPRRDYYRRGEQCTLIARSIDSLTDAELTELTAGVSYSRSYVLALLKDQAITGTMWSKHFLYLLSVGVYPLNPDDFHSGYVLEREEI